MQGYCWRLDLRCFIYSQPLKCRTACFSLTILFLSPVCLWGHYFLLFIYFHVRQIKRCWSGPVMKPCRNPAETLRWCVCTSANETGTDWGLSVCSSACVCDCVCCSLIGDYWSQAFIQQRRRWKITAFPCATCQGSMSRSECAYATRCTQLICHPAARLSDVLSLSAGLTSFLTAKRCFMISYWTHSFLLRGYLIF